MVVEVQRIGGMWNGNGFDIGELFGLVCVVWGGVRSWLMGDVIKSFYVLVLLDIRLLGCSVRSDQ